MGGVLVCSRGGIYGRVHFRRGRKWTIFCFLLIGNLKLLGVFKKRIILKRKKRRDYCVLAVLGGYIYKGNVIVFKFRN